MRRPYLASLLLLAACGNPLPVVEKPLPAQAPTPAIVSAPPAVETPPPKTVATPPLPKETAPAVATAKEPAVAAPAKAAPPAAPPKAAAPAATKGATPPPVPPVVSAPKPAPLDLKTLEQRLRETGAIGVLTKLSLKNQVDDLVARFKTFHAGQRPPTLTELRPAFELLLMKVLSLLQDGDKALANDINASRDALWGVLTDREKLATYL